MDLLNLNVDPETLAIITFFCIGFVKLVDELFSKDWSGAIKIVGSTAIGAAMGFIIPEFSFLVGAAIGLGASGVVTGLSLVGKKSSDTTAVSGSGDAIVNV